MSEATVLFPDQLFAEHPAIAFHRPIYFVEEFLFFKVQPFHKQRLVLLRAAMQRFADSLTAKGYDVIYMAADQCNKRGQFFDFLGRKGIQTIHIAEFADEWLENDLKAAASHYNWTIKSYPSPGFICTREQLTAFFSEKKHFSMAQFYAYQRKLHNLLMEGSTPVGGKYSFDPENRKKLPKEIDIPSPFIPPRSSQVEHVIKEIESEFPESYGSASPFLYPTTHEEAETALQLFLKERLSLYGDYQDAIDKDDSFLFHSVLSPALNIGLLTPLHVIQAAITYAKKHLVPLNSLEGFIRQILGWREFVRASYLLKGSSQRTANYFDHQNKIPTRFWEGRTGILPIDILVERVLKSGYGNHIERLMVLGNFFMLTETAPDEIYTWFMGCFIDAYDWVMVPNIYGMSQYADGGAIVTKPYISSSNYLLKMSNYPKGPWTEIWDGLFWRFLKKHRTLFSSNPRTLNMIRIMDKNEVGIREKIQKADLWLKEYYSP
jgi:deoxyribodipyrimidine photolyase-related protein